MRISDLAQPKLFVLCRLFVLFDVQVVNSFKFLFVVNGIYEFFSVFVSPYSQISTSSSAMSSLGSTGLRKR